MFTLNILYFILPMIFSISLLFARLTHPLAMGIILLTQTLVVCILSGEFNPCFWFSYILFLIFMGAMLILFIYVASLASNEPFKINYIYMTLFVISMILSMLFLISDPLSSQLNVYIYMFLPPPTHTLFFFRTLFFIFRLFYHVYYSKNNFSLPKFLTLFL
uniref:NADH-ubiquinone oxidoreductase chain 6 n=1 Tax=Engaewa walpolea TaxID=552823 RepID=A0A0X8DBN2_9EUCA|nr:NADH dehydrogenase subunit 6 [Engaewa walpolea]AMA98216.1 NADH dehydrogenase subunit 6 [Engaewa walpolea]